MKRSWHFFRMSLKNLNTVGTLTRSSSFVCKKMVDAADFGQAKIIVELGAGDGVLTKHILKRMAPDAKLLAFEVLPDMCAHLRNIDDSRLVVIEDSAEHLSDYVKREGFEQVDAILSAIPFVALPKDLSYRIIDECKKVLKDGGRYVQIHYSLLIKKMYQEIFGNVRVGFTILNLPPAFILTSQKGAAAA